MGTVAGLVLVALGVAPRIFRNREAEGVVRASTVLVPEVTVVKPRLGPAENSVTLPGNLQPLYSAAIYARTNGYVQKRLVDIGAQVKRGQLLAIIASPEIDQQLNQAKADTVQAVAAVEQSKAARQQALANLQIAKITRDRYAPLISKRAVTQQALDEADQALAARTADVAAAQANFDAAEANVKSKQANVGRLSELQGFERIVAPFDGVISQRNVEQGDLVSDSSNAGGKPLFTVMQGRTLRVQVEIPQSSALDIKEGSLVTLRIQERPSAMFTAKVTRTAGSVDVAARTMLTEVQVNNEDGSLLPGMYGELTFTTQSPQRSLLIPASALVVDKKGMHVVTVSSDSHVHVIPVDIGHDNGSEVEISQGLRGGEVLVSNPSDLLNDGEKVSIAQ